LPVVLAVCPLAEDARDVLLRARDGGRSGRSASVPSSVGRRGSAGWRRPLRHR